MVTRKRRIFAEFHGLRQRRAERGAAVFIVVMVLTLLTAVGIFAVRSASMADTAAGYDREASQASLIAQYATVTAATFLGTTGGTSLPTKVVPSTECQMNSQQKLPCLKLGSGPFENFVLTSSGEDLFETSSSSLNANGKTEADFVIEFTEPANTGVPTTGNQTASVQLTVTAVAQVRPAGACVNGVGTTWNAGQQMVRSYISVGNQP